MRYIVTALLVLLLVAIIFAPFSLIAGSFGDLNQDSSTMILSYFEGDVTNEIGSGHGTAYGSPVYMEFGRFGQALQFDGSDDYITYPNPLSDGDDVTYEVWLQASYQTGTYLVDGQGHYIALISGQVRTYFGGSWSGGAILVCDSVWHYIAVTHDSSESDTLIYVDGELASSQPSAGTLNTNTNPIEVGQRTGTDKYTGDLDSFRLRQNYIASAAEIKALYAMQKGAYGVID